MKFVVLFMFMLAMTMAQDKLSDYTDCTKFFKEDLQVLGIDFSVLTGYFPAGNHDLGTQTSLFFEAVTKKGKTYDKLTDDDTVIFYFGDLGTSSQEASWTGLGPFYVTNKIEPSYLKQFTANEFASFVFVDIPIFSGFSYSKSPDMKQTSADENYVLFKGWLENFYAHNIFKQFKKCKTIFMGDEGHTLVKIAAQAMKDKLVPSFVGVALNSPFIKPQSQLWSYPYRLYSGGVIGWHLYNEMIEKTRQAETMYDGESMAPITEIWKELSEKYADKMKFSRKNYESPVDNPDKKNYVKLLRKKEFIGTDFKDKYGIPDFVQEYKEFNADILDWFNEDIPLSYEGDFEYLLSHTNVTVYFGQLDSYVPYSGFIDFLDLTDIKEIKEWKLNSEKKQWKSIFSDQPDIKLGTYRKYGNFNLAVIYGSGRRIYKDKKLAIVDLVKRLVENSFE